MKTAGWPSGMVRTGSLIDFGKGEPVPFADLIEELIDYLGEDAAFFGCEAEIAHARTIVAEGTSADRQVGVYQDRSTKVRANTRRSRRSSIT